MSAWYLQLPISRLDRIPISRRFNQIHRLAPLKSQVHSGDPRNTSIFYPVFIIVIRKITGFENRSHTRLHLLTNFNKEKNYSEICKFITSLVWSRFCEEARAHVAHDGTGCGGRRGEEGAMKQNKKMYFQGQRRTRSSSCIC
jgi:hypothetical protein